MTTLAIGEGVHIPNLTSFLDKRELHGKIIWAWPPVGLVIRVDLLPKSFGWTIKNYKHTMCSCPSWGAQKRGQDVLINYVTESKQGIDRESIVAGQSGQCIIRAEYTTCKAFVSVY